MPGIFGICDFSGKLELPKTLPKMREILSYQAFFESETVLGDKVGLGRVGLEVGDRSRLAESSTGNLLVYHGRIFNLQELGSSTEAHSDAQTMLVLYQKFGPEFIQRLKGSFVLALWDAKIKQLLIGNDRFGTRPLYYVQKPALFTFSSEMKAFLGFPQFSRELNFQAISELFSFGFILEEKTLLKEVSLLPPASILSGASDKLELGSYWKAFFCDYNPGFSKEKAVEQAHSLLEQSVRQNISSIASPGLFLSGGLDSRLLLGLATKHNPNLQTFTFGTKNSLDVYLASQIAHSLGVPNHWFEISPDFLISWAEKGVWYTEGMSNCLNFAGIEVLPAVREKSTTLMNGYGRNELFGFLSGNLAKHYHFGRVDKLAGQLYSNLCRLFSPREQSVLFTPEVYKSIQDFAFESIGRVLSVTPEKSGFTKLYNFMLTQRNRRLNLLGIIMDHSYLEYSLPFFDYDLVDFALSLPASERVWAKFYRYFLIRKFPGLAKIPYQRSGLPLTAPLSLILAKRILERCGVRVIGKVLSQLTPSYLDYPSWTRGEMKEFIRSTLLPEKMSSADLFNYGFIAELLSQHFSGKAEHSARIGFLLTFEFWYRQFVRGSVPD